MTLTRVENGVTVTLSPAEEAAQLAEWAANVPPTTRVSQPTLQDVINALPLASQQTLAAQFPNAVSITSTA